MRGVCQICRNSESYNGAKLEVNGCAYCHKVMCFSCWVKHTEICEIKIEELSNERFLGMD